MRKFIALLCTVVVLMCSVSVAFASDVIMGDINKNGAVDIVDATDIQRHLAYIMELDSEALSVSDVDADGRTSVLDSTMIQQYLAKVIETFPVQPTETEPTQEDTEVETQQPTEFTRVPTDFEVEVLEIVNEERAAEGLEPVKFGYEYYECAVVRAYECCESFSHTRPDGRSCFTVFFDYGMTSYRCLGENIAYNFTSAEHVMEGWMNSEGHRANILTPEFEYLIVGAVETYEGSGRYSVTQLFYTI